MLTLAANHTITVQDNFAVIVPHPGTELTSKGLADIKDALGALLYRSHYPIIFYPHGQYSVRFCAMKELISLSDRLHLCIVSGSERTRLVYGFLEDLCSGVTIFKDNRETHRWLSKQLAMTG